MCCRREEEESLKAVLELSKREAGEGEEQEAGQVDPPTDNGSDGDLLGLDFGVTSGTDGMAGKGVGGAQMVWQVRVWVGHRWRGR